MHCQPLRFSEQLGSLRPFVRSCLRFLRSSECSLLSLTACELTTNTKLSETAWRAGERWEGDWGSATLLSWARVINVETTLISSRVTGHKESGKPNTILLQHFSTRGHDRAWSLCFPAHGEVWGCDMCFLKGKLSDAKHLKDHKKINHALCEKVLYKSAVWWAICLP